MKVRRMVEIRLAICTFDDGKTTWTVEQIATARHARVLRRITTDGDLTAEEELELLTALSILAQQWIRKLRRSYQLRL